MSISYLFGLAAAIATVLGGLIVTSQKWAERSLRYFIALGSGFMLGTVLLEMIPESVEQTPSWPAFVLAGYAIVHFFEHTFAAHLHFGEETHHDELKPTVIASALIGMSVHTFFDGVAIGAGVLISPGVGLVIFLAVFLHKIADGFTIASIVVSSGSTGGRAMFASTMLAMATLVGVIAVNLAHGPNYALPMAGGCTLYVAATDLMPEVNREKGAKMPILVFAGMGLFLLIKKVAHV